jgi:hypothetical protein
VCFPAIGAAGVSHRIRIVCSVVTLLSTVHRTVSTVCFPAIGAAGVGYRIRIVSPIITFFVSAYKLVTANIDVLYTVIQTSIARISVFSVVALFSVVYRTVSAVCFPAIGAAGISHYIGIVRSIVALFIAFDDSVSATTDTTSHLYLRAIRLASK